MPEPETERKTEHDSETEKGGKRRTDIKAGKRRPRVGWGRGKLRVISIWRVKREERNSGEKSRPLHETKLNAGRIEQGVLQGILSDRLTSTLQNLLKNMGYTVCKVSQTVN